MARKTFSKEFKVKVALEALKGEQTIAQLAAAHGVHPTQINAWNKLALKGLPELFGRASGPDTQALEAQKDRLDPQIGMLQVELGWRKKKIQGAGLGVIAWRALIAPGADAPSPRWQCELLGVNRACC